jgi:FkbM family methyltransferase
MLSTLKIYANKIYNQLLILNNPYYFYGIAKRDYIINGNTVKLNKISIEVDKEKGKPLLQGYPFACKLVEYANGKFCLDGSLLFLQIGELKFKINSAEELFILFEVFVGGAYNYMTNKEYLFIDVGMNSGITTLFHAQNPLAIQIFSYELFESTYQMAVDNLKLNKKFSDKVRSFNYGLSSTSFTQTLDYSPSRKGRMGLNGLPDDEQFNDVVQQSVIVRDVYDVFKEIVEKAGGTNIVVKMDCEGEEFNLIRRLNETKMLSHVTIFLIEWHEVQPTEIEKSLIENNFQVFCQTMSTLNTGMIYACRR